MHREMVRIEGEPVGARVRVNGIDVGNMPVMIEDEGSTGRTYRVEVSAPGYESRGVSLKQEIRASCLAASLPGIIFWPLLVNFLWCHSLPHESYRINLDRQPQTEVSAEVAPRP
jgi:hypothetical protein